MSDVLVYTAIFGRRDRLKPQQENGFDWKAITDEQESAGHNGVRVVALPLAGDPRRSARLVKIMPELFFPEYKRWIWIDGYVTLRDGVDGDALAHIPGPLAAFQHRERTCPYEEAEACRILKFDSESIIRKQIEGYRGEGFPAGGGLGETMVIVRDNTPDIRRMNRLWWEEVSQKSVRDQISFNYAAWKAGIPVHYMGRCTGTPWFRMGAHDG
jgi:TOD1/MUCI70, glycosyltransferase-like domain